MLVIPPSNAPLWVEDYQGSMTMTDEAGIEKAMSYEHMGRQKANWPQR